MARSVVLLRGDAREEAAINSSGGTIIPGWLVTYDPSEDAPHFIAHPDEGGVAAAIFARQNPEHDGKDLNTPIADEDSFTVIFPGKGAKVNAVTTDTILRGDYVESAGDGTVQEWDGSGGYVIGQAAEDSDLSHATIGRVHIIII
jgi:hypothetical protein